jgi:hypothetical protein
MAISMNQVLFQALPTHTHTHTHTHTTTTTTTTTTRYCPSCKTDTSEVIGAGESMRLTKKKAKMVSKKNSGGRDWGNGMATVGLSSKCTLVPLNHFGPIPVVPVGSMWAYRNQVHTVDSHITLAI